MTKINIQAEVETVLGRKLVKGEIATFKSLRHCGYANPYDIARKIRE